MKKIIYLLTALCLTACGDSYQEKKEALNKKHCAVTWDTATNKTALLDDIIANPDINRAGSLHVAVADLMRASAKYPATIIFDDEPLGSLAYVTKRYVASRDDATGTYTYQIPFTCENKLSMTVKQLLIIDMQYNAGCKPSQVVDARVE